jgi:glutathione S-transferase
MTLIFYYGSGSTFAWKVWLALEYKQIPYELRVLSFDRGETRSPAFLALNPRGKVPLIKDGHFALWESSAIVEYLEERKPAPSLLPGDAMKRAAARRIAAEVDHAMYPPLGRLMSATLRKREPGQDRAVATRAQAEVCEELARFETYFVGDYLVGPLSVADFALYPIIATLGRIHTRAPEFSVQGQIGKQTAAWAKRMEALPFLEKTIPPHWKQV